MELNDYLTKLGRYNFPVKSNEKIEAFKKLPVDSKQVFEFTKNHLPEELQFEDAFYLEIVLEKQGIEIYMFLIKLYLECEMFNKDPLSAVNDANDYVKHYLENKNNNYDDDLIHEREFNILDFMNRDYYKENTYNKLLNCLYLTSIYHNYAKKHNCLSCKKEIYEYELSGYRGDECDYCFKN